VLGDRKEIEAKKHATPEEIRNRHPVNSKCRVAYRGRPEPVSYDTLRHVNWNQAVRITILFDKPKQYVSVKGDGCARDGVAYRLTDGRAVVRRKRKSGDKR